MCAVPTAPAGIRRAEVGVDGRGRGARGGGARVEGVDAADALDEDAEDPGLE